MFEADQNSHTRSTVNKGRYHCEVFKIMKGLVEGLNREDFFEIEVDKIKRTRGHTENYQEGCSLDCRWYSFSQRVVNYWNALPAEAVSCTTVNSFKVLLSPHS